MSGLNCFGTQVILTIYLGLSLITTFGLLDSRSLCCLGYFSDELHEFSPEVIRCLLEAADLLEEADRKVVACDYLMAGDHSEESFLRIYHKT